jgi:hypothetical protein
MLAHVRAHWSGYLLSYAISLAIAILVLRNYMEVTVAGIAIFTLCWLASAYLDYRLLRQLANNPLSDGNARAN